VIDAGHRRKYAALAAGRPLVPCIVRPDVTAAEDDAAGQAHQVARKIAENMHRQDLAAGEEARAYQTMFDLGVKPTAIARHTGVARVRVCKGLGVARAGDDLAARADAENPETTATLIEAATVSPGHFKHALSRSHPRPDRRSDRDHHRPAVLAAPRPHHHRMADLPRRPRLRTGRHRAAAHRHRPRARGRQR